jgi:hypothetical protein
MSVVPINSTVLKYTFQLVPYSLCFGTPNVNSKRKHFFCNVKICHVSLELSYILNKAIYLNSEYIMKSSSHSCILALVRCICNYVCLLSKAELAIGKQITTHKLRRYTREHQIRKIEGTL